MAHHGPDDLDRHIDADGISLPEYTTGAISSPAAANGNSGLRTGAEHGEQNLESSSSRRSSQTVISGGVQEETGPRATEAPLEPGLGSAPQPLHDPGTGHSSNALIDWILLLLPTPLLVFAAEAALVRGVPVEGHEHRLRLFEIGQQVIVSAFPIISALIAGRFIHCLASWKLERGVQLGTLEQLMGSMTFGRTLLTLLSLRTFNITALLLLLLWALSPAGGQSALHILHVGTIPSVFYGTLPYGSVTEYSDSDFEAPDVTDSTVTLYVAALMAKAQNKYPKMDMWGNVLIPTLESLVNATDPQNSTGWIEIPTSASTVQYSSLIGVPASYPQSYYYGAAPFSFTVESSYLSLTPINISDTEYPGTAAQYLTHNTRILDFNLSYPSGSNLYAPAINDTTYSLSVSGFNGNQFGWWYPLWQQDFYNISNMTEPATILFKSSLTGSPLDSPYGSPSSQYGNVTEMYFSLTTTYVETAINCTLVNSSYSYSPNCAATSMRQSQQPHVSSNYTALGFWRTFESFTHNLLAINISTSDYKRGYAYSSPLEIFVANSLNPEPIYGGVSQNILGWRLAQVLNTWWQAGLDNIGIFDSEYISLSSAAANVTATNTTDVFALHKGWFVVFVVAAGLLQVLAMATILLQTKINGPDLLGWVGSLVRGNPYVEGEGDGRGSWMGGRHRYMKMKHRRIRMVDADDEKEVGRIAVVEEGWIGKDKGKFSRAYDKPKKYI